MQSIHPTRTAARVLAALALSCCGLFAASGAAAAGTAAPAGTVIGNQASATYSDASSVSRTVTSNTVLTTVQQVASLSLAANGAKTISPGGQVYYPQTLVNTGNGNDSFALSAAQSGAMTFSSVQFYADANGDGVPDSGTPITNTGTLQPGQVFKFVVAGVVPSLAVAGSSNTTTVTATSAFAPATTASVTDTTTVSNQGVINVTQAIDLTTGPSPSSGRTITITYTNTGNATATGVTLSDLIPSGMTYVAGSARWSVTGAGVTLTDSSNSDNQSGIVYDYGVTTSGRATAVIASVAPGASGTLTFQVDVNSGLPPGANPATAISGTYSYNDGASAVPSTNTNTIQYTVAQTAGVTFTGATVSTAPQGASVSFTDVVKNTGSGTDSFDITFGTSGSPFPAGTTFQLFQADGLTPLQDTNGNGTPDTGPLAAGASLNIVVKAVLPPGATGGPYTVLPIATSRLDSTKSATATDTLNLIGNSTVDMVNDTAVPGASGAGAGPEASPVLTLNVNPGATLRVPMIVSNGTTVADSFDLAAGTDAAVSAGLPAGWTVVFRDANNAIITSTGVLTAGSSKSVFADVTVPANYVAGTTQLYFRSLSPATGASDRLHDAVTVNTVRSLVASPNHTGQLTAGSVATYVHTITNTGNVTEGDGTTSTALITAADSATGFTSVVYWDKNNDGVLDANDPVVTSLAQLVGGTNGANTTAGLAPGKSATLFVKVTAPAGAAAGTGDTTTLTVTTSGTVNTIVAPAPAVATDSSTIVASNLTLVITQALDANCDGVPDTAYSVSPITTGAQPGYCIRYTITATNAGANPITGLVVTNATPPMTTYHAAVPAASSIGTATAPTAGLAGTVQAVVGTLAPGQSAALTYGVRITP